MRKDYLILLRQVVKVKPVNGQLEKPSYLQIDIKKAEVIYNDYMPEEINDLQKINVDIKNYHNPPSFFTWLDDITSREVGKDFYTWLLGINNEKKYNKEAY